MTSFTFAECKVSNQCSSKGRSPIGIKHFGQLSVSGLRRVPNPAAKSKALTFFNFHTSRYHNNLDRIYRINGILLLHPAGRKIVRGQIFSKILLTLFILSKSPNQELLLQLKYRNQSSVASAILSGDHTGASLQ